MERRWRLAATGSSGSSIDLTEHGIAISSRTIAVGAPGEDSRGQGVGAEQEHMLVEEDSGAVYLFAK
jgi:hypothetical protein